MNIPLMSEDEKKKYIEKVAKSFADIRSTLATLEIDICSSNLEEQSSSVWIAGQLCSWWSDFVDEIRKRDQLYGSIEQQIKDATNEPVCH